MPTVTTVFFLILICSLAACDSESTGNTQISFNDLTWQSALDSIHPIFAVYPKNGKMLFVPRYPSLYVSYDGGRTWPSIRSYPKNAVQTVIDLRSLSVCPGDTNVILACGEENLLVMKTSDGGKTWRSVCDSAEADGENIVFNPSNPAQVFVMDYLEGRLWVSQDTGSTWTLRKKTGFLRSCTLSIHPTNPDILLAGAAEGRIARSTDQGFTWSMVRDSSGGGEEIPKIEWDPDNDNYVYASVYTSNKPSLSRSTDGGKTWKDMGPRDGFWGLHIMPGSRFVIASSFTTAFISDDFGETWNFLGNPTSGFWSIKSSGERVLMTDGWTLWTLDLTGL